MNNFFRAIIAGYGAKKLGGGCFGTILVFVLIWVALGQCSFSSRNVPPPATFPAEHRVYQPDAQRSTYQFNVAAHHLLTVNRFELKPGLTGHAVEPVKTFIASTVSA